MHRMPEMPGVHRGNLDLQLQLDLLHSMLLAQLNQEPC